MALKLNFLQEIICLPMSDRIRIGTPEKENSLFLVVQRTNGEYREKRTEITIRIKTNRLEECAKQLQDSTLKKNEGTEIEGEPITKEDQQAYFTPEGKTSPDKLKITLIEYKKRWYFDLELKKRTGKITKIRVPKWNLITGLKEALGKKKGETSRGG